MKREKTAPKNCHYQLVMGENGIQSLNTLSKELTIL